MFNFKAWKDKNVVMHCKTQEEAEAFCKEMDEAGLKWSSGIRYAELSNYNIYRENTCYYFNDGGYGDLNYAIAERYKVLEYSDYMDTANDMKEFVVHCETEEQAIKLLEKLDKLGYKWNGGKPLTNKTKWGDYRHNTAYAIYTDEKCVTYGNVHTINDLHMNARKILKYSEYMKETEEEEEEEVSTRRKCLEQAIKIICSDRNDSYGNPEDNFHTMAEFTTDYLHARDLLPKDKSLTDEDAAVISILFKIARRASGRYKEDTYIDIAGYAACAMEVGEKHNE